MPESRSNNEPKRRGNANLNLFIQHNLHQSLAYEQEEVTKEATYYGSFK